jgi:quercetin dioxygenase-like cupin family protein
MSDERVFYLRGGDHATVRRSSQETDGELFEFEAELAPGRNGPPAHFHVGQRETFTVVDGLLHVRSGYDWSELGPGATVSVPPGTVHTFANRGDRPVRMIVQMTPALVFEQLLRMQAESKVPPLLRIASLNHGPDATFFLAGMPVAVQRRMWDVLAWIARSTGRTATPVDR